MRSAIRRACIGAVVLVMGLAGGGNALASHTPAHAAPGGGTVIYSSMLISMTGGVLSFTPPGTPSTPSAPVTPWSCSTSGSLTTFAASCMPTTAPPSAPWLCAIPVVSVTVTNGTPADTVVGGVDCSGTVSASCAATPPAPLTPGFCGQRGMGQGPLPFNCDADWTATLPTTDWSVRCVTVDP